jgi:hypothetical protein
MSCTACTEPQCLYSRAIPLLALWAVRPVQNHSACTRVHFTFTFTPLYSALTLIMNAARFCNASTHLTDCLVYQPSKQQSLICHISLNVWYLNFLPNNGKGALNGAVGWGTALQARRSRVRFQIVLLDFFIDIILPAALWPRGWFSLQQKWVSGIFSGGKDGRCAGLTTLPPSYTDCLEIWAPQPSETLRACPGL